MAHRSINRTMSLEKTPYRVNSAESMMLDINEKTKVNSSSL